MSGITLKIPVSPSSEDGFYSLTKNVRENTKQAIKMVVLTSPGERIMNPSFGVGIKQYLFEQFSDSLYRTVKGKIIEQVKLYIPYVDIIDVNFLDTNKDTIERADAEANVLAIEIKYAITNLNVFDSLFIEDIPTGI
jgi:phage baseplate assembly protein W